MPGLGSGLGSPPSTCLMQATAFKLSEGEHRRRFMHSISHEPLPLRSPSMGLQGVQRQVRHKSALLRALIAHPPNKA